MRCKFCWRVQSYDLEVKWNETEPPIWESAEKIVYDSINAQRKFLSGYKSQVKNGIISIKKFNEAMEPKHVAISLSGEPSLYPDLSELIYEFHKRDFTSFLVTNGTYPDRLERISNNPSQIYVSLCAPNKKVFHDICRPLISNAWEKLMTTLSLIQSFNCPTVIRLTSVKGLNMKNVEEYSKIIREASPSYVEVKAYMYIGYSRKRMRFNNMPNHLEIRRFGESLSERTGYKLVDESPDSRVVLLTNLDKPLPIHNKS
jgi:tRNA wybutosine-synthesizing protein 1